MKPLDDDMERARAIVELAIGEHANLLEAHVAGLPIIRQRDRAVELCIAYADQQARVHYSRMNSETRCELQDLVQCARIGAYEAINKFNPRVLTDAGTPIKLKTFIQWQIRLRIQEERHDSHWTIAKPTRAESRRYMQGKMTREEAMLYYKTFIGVEELRV